MKRMKLIFFVCSLLIIPCVKGQVISQTYDFPIKPGTTEWSGLVTESERFNAMQIPDDILSRLTTLALVKTCLNFPAFGYITAYENSQTGFVILATKFNGLKELANRPNAARHLINIYKETGETGFLSPNLHLDEKYWTIKFNWIEILLTQNKMLSSISNEDKKNLLIICQDKFKIKQISEDFSLDGLKSTAFLMVTFNS